MGTKAAEKGHIVYDWPKTGRIDPAAKHTHAVFMQHRPFWLTVVFSYLTIAKRRRGQANLPVGCVLFIITAVYDLQRCKSDLYTYGNNGTYT